MGGRGRGRGGRGGGGREGREGRRGAEGGGGAERRCGEGRGGRRGGARKVLVRSRRETRLRRARNKQQGGGVCGPRVLHGTVKGAQPSGWMRSPPGPSPPRSRCHYRQAHPAARHPRVHAPPAPLSVLALFRPKPVVYCGARGRCGKGREGAGAGGVYTPRAGSETHLAGADHQRLHGRERHGNRCVCGASRTARAAEVAQGSGVRDKRARQAQAECTRHAAARAAALRSSLTQFHHHATTSAACCSPNLSHSSPPSCLCAR
jgi:hypothetical protein